MRWLLWLLLVLRPSDGAAAAPLRLDRSAAVDLELDLQAEALGTASASMRRPKSVFVVPSRPLPVCAPGYRLDPRGRCIKIVEISQQAQLAFLIDRLNQRFAAARLIPSDVPNAGSEPVRLDLTPATSGSSKSMGEEPPATDGDEQQVAAAAEAAVAAAEVAVAVPVPPSEVLPPEISGKAAALSYGKNLNQPLIEPRIDEVQSSQNAPILSTLNPVPYVVQ